MINGPGPKAVPKRLDAEPINKRWFIVPLALWTVALFACVLDHRLSAPGLSKFEINYHFFVIFARPQKAFSLVPGAEPLRSDSDHRAATHRNGPLVRRVALWRS